ncbi:MAG: VOC family protein, partial [Acidobacteria bacterium]|nr:VOC family protein [Acidobacteriota bacterium]
MMNTAMASKAVFVVAVSLSVFARNLETPANLESGSALGRDHAARTSADHLALSAPDSGVFHQVAQVTWVVKDIDRVVSYWQQLGVKDIRRDGVIRIPNLSYRGKADPASAKQVTAHIGQLEIKWIQPLQGGRFWRNELRDHGEGIRVLSYLVQSPRQFNEQINYFASKGVGLVIENKWQTSKGQGRMAYL